MENVAKSVILKDLARSPFTFELAGSVVRDFGAQEYPIEKMTCVNLEDDSSVSTFAISY